MDSVDELFEEILADPHRQAVAVKFAVWAHLACDNLGAIGLKSFSVDVTPGKVRLKIVNVDDLPLIGYGTTLLAALEDLDDKASGYAREDEE